MFAVLHHLVKRLYTSNVLNEITCGTLRNRLNPNRRNIFCIELYINVEPIPYQLKIESINKYIEYPGIAPDEDCGLGYNKSTVRSTSFSFISVNTSI